MTSLSPSYYLTATRNFLCPFDLNLDLGKSRSQCTSMASAQASPDVIPLFLRANFQDVRFMVYDILEAQPSNDFDPADRNTVADQTEEEYELLQKFGETRKALRETCKQIKDEWSGKFLRSTTICLNTVRTPERFEAELLNSLNRDDIKHIARLSYDGSRPHMFLAGHFCPNLPRRDARGLEKLAPILRRQPLLQLKTLDINFGAHNSRLFWWLFEEPKSRIESRLLSSLSRFNIKDFDNLMMATALKDSFVVRLYEVNGFRYFFRRIKPAVTDEVYGRDYGLRELRRLRICTTVNTSDEHDDPTDDGIALNEETPGAAEEEESDEQSEAADAKDDISIVDEETASSCEENDSDVGCALAQAANANTASERCLSSPAWKVSTNKRKRAFTEVEE